MLKGAVARRYAEAVFDLGVQQGTLDRWQSDLRLIAEAYSNRKLSFILRQPKILFARKQAIVRDLLEQRVTQQALGLALLLVERELVELAPKIAEEFDQKLNNYRGLADAVVTSAAPLGERQKAEVASYLEGLTGKHINLEIKVDPSILGGIIAQIGDTLIDGSVRRRLALLHDQIIRGAVGGPDDGAARAPLDDGHGPTTPPVPAAPPATPAAPAGKTNGQPTGRPTPEGKQPPPARPSGQQPGGQPPRGNQPPPGKQPGNKPGNGNRPKR